MITEEDSKYLTEKMGLCWHEWIDVEDDWPECKKCKVRRYHVWEIDFSSERGFFVAWNWMKLQTFEGEFWVWIFDKNRNEFWNQDFKIMKMLVGPLFAEELVKFLKGRGK